MDDEFALCWNNFQDNIASGFQNLYDRGDLVDVTIACDGKLLHAHKIVLAICSPYFQEMFIVNPCKHPIIILKDVSYNVMCELLQFMYQGVVNVKHTELSTFMKIAQTLQVKGLTTSSSSHSQKSPSHNHHHHHHQHQHNIQYSTSNNNNNNNHNNKSGGNGNSNNNNNNNNNSTENSGNNIENKINSLSSYSPNTTAATNSKNLSSENQSSAPSSLSGTTSAGSGGGSLKRSANEFFNSMNSVEGLSIYPRKQMKRFSIENNNSDHDINNDSMDNMNSSDDAFLPPIPQISMIESSSTSNNGGGGVINCSGNLRNSLPPPFNFEYGMYAAAAANKSIEYPNELHIGGGDYSKNLANHVDIPSGTNITMISSTSLLHGSCVFNRNNTVATQQGMKTYWLCKSYRITMCRARCITHQGRVISATGVHNHPPHMKSPTNNEVLNPVLINSISNNNNNVSSNNNMIPGTGQISSNCLTTTNNNSSGSPSSSAGLAGNNNNNNNNSTGVMRLPQNPNIIQHHFPGSPAGNGGQQQQHLTSHHDHHSPSSPLSSSSQQLLSPHSQLHHTTSGSMHQGAHHQHSHSVASNANAAVLQNMMQNVLTQNNLMHLTNMAPMLNSFPSAQHHHPSQLNSGNNVHHHHHHHQQHHQQSPSSLQIAPILTDSSTTDSPSNRSSSHSQSQMDSPNLQSNSMVESPQSGNNTNDGNTNTPTNSANSNNNNIQSVVSSSSIVSVSDNSPHDDGDNNTCTTNGCQGPNQGQGRGTIVNDRAHDSSNSSSQTNIISSITIPSSQNSFKMEHI